MRRAASPSINTDKSLKNIKPPQQSSDHRPSILAIHQGAGVSKKSKNGRKAVLSRKAKARQEMKMGRAEAVMDQKETKIVKSKVKGRNVQDRAKDWERQNEKFEALKRATELLEKENEEWSDEEGHNDGKADGIEGDVNMAGASTIVKAALDTTESAVDEEEIL